MGDSSCPTKLLDLSGQFNVDHEKFTELDPTVDWLVRLKV